MNNEKEMVEELKRIEKILRDNQDAEAPGLPSKSDGEDLVATQAPVDPEAIFEAENQTRSLGNQMLSINATLQALLSEVQGLSETLKSL